MFKIPHSIIFPNQPPFCLPPRVFGRVCFVHIPTLGQDKLSAKATKCVFLGYSRLQRGYRGYSLDTHQYFAYVDVTFFENSSMFPTTHPSVLMSYLYPFFILSRLPHLYLRLLYLDHCRFILYHCPRIDIGPLADSSPMTPSSTTSVFPSPVDLPIAVWKGTRSSHNPHLIYSFLTYRRLSSPYYVFISTLSSVSLPKTVHEALSRPDWKQAMVALHSTGT